MNVKKVKRKCQVRGCKDTDTFAIALAGEVGNTVIICRNCLKEGVSATENYSKGIRQEKPKRGIPPLFFGGTRAVKASESQESIPQSDTFTQVSQEGEEVTKETEPQSEDVTDEGESDSVSEDDGQSLHRKRSPSLYTREARVNVTDEDESVNEFTCPHCGVVCKTKAGLEKHIAAKHKDVSEC